MWRGRQQLDHDRSGAGRDDGRRDHSGSDVGHGSRELGHGRQHGHRRGELGRSA
jgi:hypothetical protein